MELEEPRWTHKWILIQTCFLKNTGCKHDSTRPRAKGENGETWRNCISIRSALYRTRQLLMSSMYGFNVTHFLIHAETLSMKLKQHKCGVKMIKSIEISWKETSENESTKFIESNVKKTLKNQLGSPWGSKHPESRPSKKCANHCTCGAVKLKFPSTSGAVNEQRSFKKHLVFSQVRSVPCSFSKINKSKIIIHSKRCKVHSFQLSIVEVATRNPQLRNSLLHPSSRWPRTTAQGRL